MCKKIHRGGNAEQYHADKKYKEAVAVAVEACADDTKGQTCYICTEAVHWKTKEGLVRMCACRGTAGFAHVSCLAEQAKILVAEAEENNLDDAAFDARWGRWHTCRLCEQGYHGVVACALGWACWKTYVGRPESDIVLRLAMSNLGNALGRADCFAEALSVQEAELASRLRVGAPDDDVLVIRTNMAVCYTELGRHEEALELRRAIYAKISSIDDCRNHILFTCSLNLAISLHGTRRYSEAISFMREQLPKARRAFGAEHDIVIHFRWTYGVALLDGSRTKDKHEASRDDLAESTAVLEEVSRTSRRVLGPSHPFTKGIQRDLLLAQEELTAFDAS
jgi:hypothetical protein